MVFFFWFHRHVSLVVSEKKLKKKLTTWEGIHKSIFKSLTFFFFWFNIIVGQVVSEKKLKIIMTTQYLMKHRQMKTDNKNLKP